VTQPATTLDIRSRIAAANASEAERFWSGEDVGLLLTDRAASFDTFIRELWEQVEWPDAATDQLALFAVGGYGRGELHPYSDIDLLILCESDPVRFEAQLERFVQSLWDLNLDIGHSVRSIDECRAEADTDITVATTLLERRLLCGPLALDRRIGELFATDEIWPSAKFFKAKVDEQHKRHARYQDVEYDLEPNIKGAPGGLRDIHTIGWIIRRHFGNTVLEDLPLRGFLTDEELARLNEGKQFLWRVRYGLHLIAERGEDRLLFDHQRELASRLGYTDSEAQLGVEQFMHDYYRHVLALREVNDVLLQHFDEAILRAHYIPEIEAINERFQIRDSYIETIHEKVFEQQPSALLELFVIMANRRDIAGVRATTIRLVRSSLDLITEDFRNDPAVTALFIDLLRAPYTLVSQLTRMRRYGVLGRYIPEFGDVIGQMQHDLFHIYTVDAHTMMVIRNMRRFHYRSSQETFPVACHCVKNLPKIELLYIAGLYHDVGKGRGGNHSELGAADAIKFCTRHGLDADDTALVEWLVCNHLVMSAIAQRQDIHDPGVIHAFAAQVRSEQRLDYLYALTVADINATNPTLWNSWRATLMRQLYNETRKALRRGLETPVDRSSTIQQTMHDALDRLEARGMSRDHALGLWDSPDPDIFLQHSASRIVAITEAIDGQNVDSEPLVMIRDLPGQVSNEGATEIFLYARNQPNLFAASVIAMGQLGLSILDARIYTSTSDRCFNTYIVLDESGQPLDLDDLQRAHIRTTIARQLRYPIQAGTLSPRRMPRRLRQFQRPTEARIDNDPSSSYSLLVVEASDRPGILAQLGLLFVELSITVHNARITTLGERIEDTFYISGKDQGRIEDPAVVAHLTRSICSRLDADLATSMHSAQP
jgi:[protein-PII] uridylyltransferase